MALSEVNQEYGVSYITKYGLDPSDILQDGMTYAGYRSKKRGFTNWPKGFDWEEFHSGYFGYPPETASCRGCGSKEFVRSKCSYCRRYV